MNKRAYLSLLGVVFAGCFGDTAKPPAKELDPCNEGGANIGAEVPIKIFEPAPGCIPNNIVDYTPTGLFGKKLFTKRSAESVQKSYACGATPLAINGIDFTKEAVEIVQWEHPESEGLTLRSIRDDGKRLVMVYELGQCSTGRPNAYKMESTAYILPAKDRVVDVQKCPVKRDLCAK